LGPFYHNDLLKAVNGCSEIVVCFDERGQMDIVVRYWNLNDHIVSTRYFGSAFMGHATSDDLLASFRSALAAVPLSSLLQVSMDGPTVNWKFLDLLEKCMEDGAYLIEADQHGFMWAPCCAWGISKWPQSQWMVS